MDKDQKHKVFELVAGLIATDGVLHEAENALLSRVGDKLGLTESEVVMAPTLGSIEAGKAMSSLPRDVRKEALDLLIDAAIVDGNVAPDEQYYLKAVGAASGVSEDQLAERIADRLLEDGKA